MAIPPVRRFALRRLQQLWAWAVVRLNPPGEVDELAEEMRLVMRGERLRADVRRVQLLLLTDTSMPATRQMGNRIAYEWLVRELDRYTREVSDVIVYDWSGARGATGPNAYAPGLYRPSSNARVEVLELGWKR